jgi:protein-ribulosamine 3-kinase
MLEQVAESISQSLGQTLNIISHRPLSGGSINQVSCIGLDNGSEYFLKTQRGKIAKNTFQIEHDSLLLLAQAKTLRVPRPLIFGKSFLVMEFISKGQKAADWQEQMGRQLALLHQSTQQLKYGFYCDNYLGTSLQINTWKDDWLSFWRDNRLEPQFKLFSEEAGAENSLIKKGHQLLEKLDSYLGQVKETAVLLHGDLWSGNAMADANGAPVIFDPACYYGHREAEFGMMRMFGGFGARCEASYAEVWPFSDGYEDRFKLYQLYHQLNHLNLFGNAYYADCMASIDALL